MSDLPRVYDAIFREHLARNRQMLFATGPRQVGKTTACRKLSTVYLDWDNIDDRRLILSGATAVAARAGLDTLSPRPSVIAFDEMHKHRKWKAFLKGFFDTYGDRVRCLVTGSSRMDVYRRGGDSLVGRYFTYRLHPFSIAEVARQDVPSQPIRPPMQIADEDFAALLAHGGYPEPFVRRDPRFTRRWQTLRSEQLLREDIRDLTRVHELGQIEVFATLLAERSGGPLVLANLAQEVGISVDTSRRWVEALRGLHIGFLVRPWFKNVAKSLRKEPKWYMRDWSICTDPGVRAETFVACHLLKAVEGWTDLGLGDFDLRYLRDKDKREVDFLVVRDKKPWFLVEVKAGDPTLSPSLRYFQEQTRAEHAFQASLEAPYVDADCFDRHDPVVVPARTLLSQLL